MRKNELIKILEGINGNPEVVIWNGHVDDYNNISRDVESIELVKKSREFLEAAINHQRSSEGLGAISDSEMSDIMQSQEWDLPNRYVADSDMERWYGKKRKRIVVLEPVARGKKYFDRLGAISY